MAKKLSKNPFMGDMNVQILRLKNGQDVICNIKNIDKETSSISIECPLDIDVTMINEKKIIILSPWIPLEITDENNCMIRSSDILTFIKPRISLITQYIDLYWSINSLIKDYDFLESISKSSIN